MKVTQAMVDAAKVFMFMPVADHLHAPSGDPWIKAMLEAAIGASTERVLKEPSFHCRECRAAYLDDRVPDCLGDDSDMELSASTRINGMDG